MNTHDIELPAEFRSGNDIPVTQATIKRERMQEILRDAIEADRRGRMPSDAEILACLRPLYSNDVAAAMGAEDDLRTARLLLSRYSGGQPAASAEPTAAEISDVVREIT